MNNLQHLPPKFAFKLDELGKRWIRETFGKDYEIAKIPYFNFDQKKGFNWGHLDQSVRQNHTLISTSQLFPQPQIPTIEKGVMMLVWDDDDESKVKEREVMFFDGKSFYARSSISNNCLPWKHAKPIPQIPEYTIEEAEKKFNIKIKKECTQQNK